MSLMHGGLLQRMRPQVAEHCVEFSVLQDARKRRDLVATVEQSIWEAVPASAV